MQNPQTYGVQARQMVEIRERVHYLHWSNYHIEGKTKTGDKNVGNNETQGVLRGKGRGTVRT